MRTRGGAERAFHRGIRRWYRAHGRDLPWRRTRDPYRIAVSEVMLQQTQVDRVIPKYRAFLRAFPSWNSLARAPLAAVLRAWSGLGYNRRAKQLRELARAVAEEHGGRLPRTEAALRALPGIGQYTARAIRVFAFRARSAPQDTNIARVTRRYFFGARAVPVQELRRKVEASLPRRDAYAWNHALMDFGALVCTSRAPKCGTCPLRTACKAAPAFLAGFQEAPLRKQKLPFLRTTRFLRGEIIRRLLARPARAPQLIARLRVETGFSARAIARTLKALEREGLIHARRGALEAGSTT